MAAVLRELVLVVDAAAAESLGDALLAVGALSVTVEDAAAGTEREQALFGEPGGAPEREAWETSRLVALVGAGDDPEQLLTEACAGLNMRCPPIELVRPVADADWVRLTQAQFAPVQISDRLWIVPSWHEPPPGASIAIRLDPGVAFGTGTHPTTRLCLQWLDTQLQPGATVLDYGCGSGILAIAAARLGARAVIGVDIDPQAIAAAAGNSAVNLAGHNALAHYTLPSALPADALQSNYYFDIVVANILSNPLKVLAPALAARVAAGGALVLSGVLARQADEVIAAYRLVAPALPLSVWREDDGWVCLAGRRSA